MGRFEALVIGSVRAMHPADVARHFCAVCTMPHHESSSRTSRARPLAGHHYGGGQISSFVIMPGSRCLRGGQAQMKSGQAGRRSESSQRVAAGHQREPRRVKAGKATRLKGSRTGVSSQELLKAATLTIQTATPIQTCQARRAHPKDPKPRPLTGELIAHESLPDLGLRCWCAHTAFIAAPCRLPRARHVSQPHCDTLPRPSHIEASDPVPIFVFEPDFLGSPGSPYLHVTGKTPQTKNE